MLKRSIIIIVFLLVYSPLLYGKTPTPTKTSNKPQNQTAIRQDQCKIISDAAQIPMTVTPFFIAPDTQIETSDKTEKKNDKSSADWWLVYFTAALVAVVFFQFIWMVRQEKWMRRNVDISQKAADAAKNSADALQVIERARLFVKVKRDPPPKQGEPIESIKEGHNRVLISIINEGKSLAIITKINWYIGVMNDKEIDNKISVLESTNSEFPDGLITIRGNDSEDIPVMGEITNTDLQKIDYSTTYFVCLGYIKYKDVFRKVRPVIFYWKDNGVFFFSDEPPTRNHDT